MTRPVQTPGREGTRLICPLGSVARLLRKPRVRGERQREREELVMSVGQVCVCTVVTARPEESVTAAAKRMRQYNVGTLVVVNGKHPVGIITESVCLSRRQSKTPCT